jgi:outer membrane autotransporter protein
MPMPCLLISLAARVVTGLALFATMHAAMAQLAPGTTIRILPPDGLTIDANGQTNGGTVEVLDPRGVGLANVALTRTRITSTGATQGSASGLATNANGIFSQGTLTWGTGPQEREGGANRYCLDNVPAAEAGLACVDVTVLGTVITSVRGTKAYVVGGTAMAASVGAATRASSTTALQSVRVQLGHVQARLRALRLGANTGWVNDTTIQINGRSVPMSASSASSDSPPGSGDEAAATRSTGWGGYVMGTAALEEGKNGNALKVQTDGLSVGTDYRLSRRAVVGAAAGFAKSDSDVSGLPQAQSSKGTSLTLYGSYEPAPQWYVDAAVSVARNDFTLKRATASGGLAHADTRGSGTGLSITSGYQFVGGTLIFSPYARVDALRVSIDGYTETGDTPVTVNEQSVRSNSFALGSELQYIIPTRYAIVVPHVRVEMQRQSQSSPQGVTATLVGSGVQLSAESQLEADKSFGHCSVGLSAQFKRGVSAFVDYETLFARSDVSERRVNLGMKLEF